MRERNAYIREGLIDMWEISVTRISDIEKMADNWNKWPINQGGARVGVANVRKIEALV